MIVAIVVNWNGWSDTLDCVQSLAALDGPAFELVVCDNGSTNDSFERIAQGLRERFGCRETRLVVPYEGMHVFTRPLPDTEPFARVHLLRLGVNGGYAAGLNRCMAWADSALRPSMYWLLNNDVAFQHGALAHMADALTAHPDIGLCGSVLLEWDAPHAVQALGGRLNRALAVGSHIRRLPAAAQGADTLAVDYPVGASMLANRAFVETVGLLDEGYFLYYEEVDWAERGRRAGFRPSVALRSRVLHKEGASTGSRGGVRHKSLLSEHYGVVNRLRFTWKFNRWWLPVVWLSLLLVVLDRMSHREWLRAGLVFSRMVWPLAPPPVQP